MHRFLVYLLGPDATLFDALLAAVDLFVVAYLVYRLLRLIRGTKAAPVLVGLFLVGFAWVAARALGLETLSWVLGHFLSYSFIFGIIVLFQSDLRRALAELGRRSRLLAFLGGGGERASQLGVVEAVVKGTLDLAQRRVGALIVLERSAELAEVVDTGLRLDAAVSSELLVSIFQPQSPLHDGAAVIQAARIAAAGCLLPLSSSAAPHELGTRHRAALGLAEEVDAAVVVVSEERGEISVALDGALQRRLDERSLRALLEGALAGPSRGRGPRPAAAAPRPAPVRRGEGEPRAAL